MKKLLTLLLAVLISVSVSAEIMKFRTTAFATKQIDSYGYWQGWSDWESSNLLITLNTNTDDVYIYSSKLQHYHITSYQGTKTETDGSKQSYLKFYDQDGDNGTMRLRVESSGSSQIYVEFANVMWVYNVKRIQ